MMTSNIDNIMSVVLLSLLLIYELIQQAVSAEFQVVLEHFEQETGFLLPRGNFLP